MSISSLLRAVENVLAGGVNRVTNDDACSRRPATATAPVLGMAAAAIVAAC